MTIRLFASRIADAIIEGRQIGTEGGVISETSETEGGEAAVSEAEIQVADKSFGTAEATHQADETDVAGSTASGVTGADGKGDARAEVSETGSSSASEAMTDVAGATPTTATDAKEESTEASA